MESIPLSQAKELAPDRDVAIGDILYFDKGLLGMAAFVCGVGDTEASAEKDCWERAEKLGTPSQLPSIPCRARLSARRSAVAAALTFPPAACPGRRVGR
jgi:hypothetical protein